MAKVLKLIMVLLLLFPWFLMADVGGGGSVASHNVIIGEQDGSPRGAVRILNTENGTLTKNAEGNYTYSTSGLGYAKYSFGSNNFSDTGNFTTTGIVNATSFIGGMSKSFVITSPTATADSPLWTVPDNITISRVCVNCIDGTNIIGQITKCDVNGTSCSAIDADITATTNTTVCDDGSLSDPSFTSSNMLGWNTTSISGTPTRAIISFEY